MQVGDWVQAVSEVTEDLPDGSTYVHADPGNVGHVLEILPDPNWVNVFFERSGTITVVHVEELKILGNALVGR